MVICKLEQRFAMPLSIALSTIPGVSWCESYHPPTPTPTINPTPGTHIKTADTKKKKNTVIDKNWIKKTWNRGWTKTAVGEQFMWNYDSNKREDGPGRGKCHTETSRSPIVRGELTKIHSYVFRHDDTLIAKAAWRQTRRKANPVQALRVTRG